jgi:HK97 family phage major capsid protein
MELSHGQSVIRLDAIRGEMERLQTKEELTPEDETTFAELAQEFRDVDSFRRSLERTAALDSIRSLAEGRGGPVKVERVPSAGDGFDRDPILSPESVEDARHQNPWDLSQVRTFGRDGGEVAAEFRSRALDAITKMPGCTDNVREAATGILEKTVDHPDKLARQILLTSSPAYMRAWSKLARHKEHSMTDVERRALDAVEEFRAMSLTNTAGGYLIPFQLDPSVIITADGSRNDIRQAARVVQATGNVWQGVSSGAVSWSWDAEASEVSDDATTFAQPAITIYTARGFVPISMEALEDEANVTAEVARLLAFGKDVLESTAFSTGTGSAQPFGIVTAIAGTSSEINAAADDTFAIGDVYTIQGALPGRYRGNAAWLANNAIYNLIRRFDTSGGGGFWENLGGSRPSNLLGRPALEAEAMDGTVTTSGAVSNFILVFGDFSNYVIADRIGMSVEFIPHMFHLTTNRPSGQRGWFAHYRVGADSVNDGAFRLLDVPSAA